MINILTITVNTYKTESFMKSKELLINFYIIKLKLD